ncbi:hypothetical protein [Amaricoccus macauensis]|uniref:hypothetical protein n=1 Tax=Amaricoccus macauensis TaxID=57001 RepID=UPI003C7B210F
MSIALSLSIPHHFFRSGSRVGKDLAHPIEKGTQPQGRMAVLRVEGRERHGRRREVCEHLHETAGLESIAKAVTRGLDQAVAEACLDTDEMVGAGSGLMLFHGDAPETCPNEARRTRIPAPVRRLSRCPVQMV